MGNDSRTDHRHHRLIRTSKVHTRLGPLIGQWRIDTRRGLENGPLYLSWYSTKMDRSFLLTLVWKGCNFQIFFSLSFFKRILVWPKKSWPTVFVFVCVTNPDRWILWPGVHWWSNCYVVGHSVSRPLFSRTFIPPSSGFHRPERLIGSRKWRIFRGWRKKI